MRRVDLDAITFDSGAYDVGPEQYPKLKRLARTIQRALRDNPDEVFMIEGHTDAVGADESTDSCQRFGKTVRIAEAGVEKALLTHERTCGHEAEIHRLDRGGGVQRREVRVQRAKKNCRVGGGLGQPEAARVARVVLEAEREFDPGGDVLRRDQFE